MVVVQNTNTIQRRYVQYRRGVEWYRKSAEAGNADAQCRLGGMYGTGDGVEQDQAGGIKWLQLAAVQGDEIALKCLDALQQGNEIPTPPPGTAVTTIMLTSAKAAKYNTMIGRLVEPIEGSEIKPGRVAVLLDGEIAPISFNFMGGM